MNYVVGTNNSDVLNGTAGQDFIWGYNGNDYISAGDGPDIVYAGIGDDSVYGGGGTDVLMGEAGDDYLVAGASGGDTLNGGDGVDSAGLVDHQYQFSDQTVNLATGATNDGIKLIGIENLEGGAGTDRFDGNAGDNTLWGMEGTDVLDGNAGDDWLQGGTGSDWLDGGQGADSLWGGGGRDTIMYDNSTAAVTVHLDLGYGYGGEAQGDTYFLVEDVYGSNCNDFLGGDGNANAMNGLAGNDRMVGYGGNDTLFGDAGYDSLSGGAGNDVLNGGSEKDNLNGGTGADHFAFGATSDSGFGASKWDIVQDFNHGEADKIDLSNIDANSNVAGDQAFAFKSGAFTGAGQVHVTYANGNTYVDANTSGNGGVDMQIELTGHHTMVASDFIL